jgi:hypothetical protein
MLNDVTPLDMNAPIPIVANVEPEAIVTVVREPQESNALFPISVTEAGIVTDFSAVHAWKAFAAILVVPADIATAPFALGAIAHAASTGRRKRTQKITMSAIDRVIIYNYTSPLARLYVILNSCPVFVSGSDPALASPEELETRSTIALGPRRRDSTKIQRREFR